MIASYEMHADRPLRRSIRWLLPLGLLVAAGCGSAPSACDITGTVQVDSQPAAGVYVLLYPQGTASNQPPLSSDCTDRDGRYQLSADGPGDYAVTLFWPEVMVDEDQTWEGPDRLKGKHRSPMRPALAASIATGKNALPTIEVKLPQRR